MLATTVAVAPPSSFSAPLSEETVAEPAEDDRARIIEALGPTPVEIDEIIRFTGLPARLVHVVLLELDLAGRIERHRASAYRCVRRAPPVRRPDADAAGIRLARLAPGLEHRHVDQIGEQREVVGVRHAREPARLDGDVFGRLRSLSHRLSEGVDVMVHRDDVPRRSIVADLCQTISRVRLNRLSAAVRPVCEPDSGG